MCIRSLFLVGFSILMASCAKQLTEVNSLSEISRITGKLPSDKATVFLHYPTSAEQIQDAQVTVDEGFVVKLTKGSITKLTLSPGIHVIDMKFPKLTGPNCQDLKFSYERDTVYHLVLVDGPEKPTFANLMVDELIYSSAHLRFIHPRDGLQISRYEKYIAASHH